MADGVNRGEAMDNSVNTRELKDSVLIVEDSEVQAIALREILISLYDVTYVTTAERGLEELHTGLYDLILLDIILPDMNGLELLKKLKDNDETRKIPVIIITGLKMSGYEEKGLTLGAVDYILKPFMPLAVKARVKVHIDMQKYIKQLEKLTYVDQLTGVGNRRLFDESFKEMWVKSARSRKAFTICMFDIDNFKAYNDTFGHPEGDKVLTSIGEVLRTNLRRRTDLAARYGGEEFVVIMLDGGSKEDFDHICGIRKKIEDLHIKHCLETRPFVTTSIGGVTVYPRKEEDSSAFLKIADDNIYRAKALGKDMVVWTSDRMEEWREERM